MEQWLPVHPGVITDGAFAPADGTIRYVGVPPVTGTTDPLQIRPSLLELFRTEDFYLSLDSGATSRAAFRAGNFYHIIPLNPGVQTISYSATRGTAELRGNWIFSE